MLMASHHGHVEVARLLIEAEAVIGKAKDEGGTSLLVASQEGHLEVGRLLIEARAAIEEAPDDSGTPMHIASEQGYLSVVKTLLDSWADTTVAALGSTPLQTAMRNNHRKVASLLEAALR